RFGNGWLSCHHNWPLFITYHQLLLFFHHYAPWFIACFLEGRGRQKRTRLCRRPAPASGGGLSCADRVENRVDSAAFKCRVRLPPPLFFLFGREIKGVTLHAAHLCCLFCLGFGDVARIDRNDTSTPLVRRHHDLVGMAFIHPEN